MPDFILNLDRHLFYFINHDLSNAFFDWIMPVLREPKTWIPLYVFIIAFCLWKYKKTGLVIILLLIAAVGMADFTSGVLMKHNIQRLRPCRDPVVAVTYISRVPCGSGYSFPSTHATDHFAIAIFLCFVLGRKWKWIWIWGVFWAGSICFAQVYVGVHFPVDVVCGAIYGAFAGWLFSLLFKKLQPSF